MSSHGCRCGHRHRRFVHIYFLGFVPRFHLDVESVSPHLGCDELPEDVPDSTSIDSEIHCGKNTDDEKEKQWRWCKSTAHWIWVCGGRQPHPERRRKWKQHHSIGPPDHPTDATKGGQHRARVCVPSLPCVRGLRAAEASVWCPRAASCRHTMVFQRMQHGRQ